jgi:ABC-type glycerol-3-phosphate transport system permease component
MLTIIWILMAAMIVFLLYPLFIMFMGSFKTSTEIASNPAGFPERIQFGNYVALLGYNGGIMVRAYLNSIFVSTVHTALVVFVAAMAAFAFAKYEFKGKNVFFFMLLATMMVPGELNIPPLYIMFSKIGWLNSYEVQIFPGIASVFAMFMFRQYMESVPTSLLEAARIDGAGHFQVFRKIMMPVAMPVAGTLSILTFLGKWNDYLWPIIMVSERDFQPIMAILPTLNTKEDAWFIPWELVLTGCVVVTIPMIIVFCMFQEQFMSSVTIGAVKE